MLPLPLLNQLSGFLPVTRSDGVQFLSGVSVWLIVIFKRLDPLRPDFGYQVEAVRSDISGMVGITGTALAMAVILVESELTGLCRSPEVPGVIADRRPAAATDTYLPVPSPNEVVKSPLSHVHPVA